MCLFIVVPQLWKRSAAVQTLWINGRLTKGRLSLQLSHSSWRSVWVSVYSRSLIWLTHTTSGASVCTKHHTAQQPGNWYLIIFTICLFLLVSYIKIIIIWCILYFWQGGVLTDSNMTQNDKTSEAACPTVSISSPDETALVSETGLTGGR